MPRQRAIETLVGMMVRLMQLAPEHAEVPIEVLSALKAIGVTKEELDPIMKLLGMLP